MRNVITFLAVMSVATAAAQVRVYDYSSGKDVDAEREGIQRAPESGTNPAVDFTLPELPNTQLPVKQPKPQAPTGVSPTPLGQAVIFVNVKDFSPELAQKLKTIYDFRSHGLDIKLYMESLRPEDYYSLLDEGLEHLPKDIEFKVDTGSRQGKRFRVGPYRTVIYADPTGSQRRYDLVSEFPKFERHLKRIQRQVGKRR